MSEANVKAFSKAVVENDELRNRYKALLESMKPAEGAEIDEAKAMGKVVEFASQNGYVFTAEDLKKAGEEMKGGAAGELTDEQLEAVAGGGLGIGFIVTIHSGPTNEPGGGMVCFFVGWEW